MILFLKQGGLVAVDILLEIINFPVWWYGAGFKKVFGSVLLAIKNAWAQLELYNLVNNLTTPMFGRYSTISRILSAVVVVLITLGRVFQILIVSLWYLAILVLWLGLWPVSLWLVVSR